MSDSPRERLRSYGGDVVEATVSRPRTIDELRDVLARAHRDRKPITFRGGGHAFDTQSLNTGHVVSLAGLDEIRVDPAQATVTVQAGASWGNIVKETVRHGMIPYVTVTTKHATAAGTASADCISRFSPSCGKESTHILSIRLLTLAGDEMRCDRTKNRDVFFAAVGGLGYLGVIVTIKYALLRLDFAPAVETEVRPCASLAELVHELVPRVHACHRRRCRDREPTSGSEVAAIYGVCFKKRALLFHSHYVDTKARKPLPILHEPEKLRRRFVDLLLRIRIVNTIVWWFVFNVMYRRPRTYVDNLEDFTFFMDGNVHAKELGRRLGLKMLLLQQTFVVPALSHDDDSSGATSLRETANAIVSFLDATAAQLAKRRLVPTLIDLLFIPKDEGFLLSASNERSGYAITFAFDTSNERVRSRARQFLVLASDLCQAAGGRVSLVKNVCADAPRIAAMYGDDLRRFLAVKQRLDPHNLLRNEFFERVIASTTERRSAPSAESARQG